MIIPYQEVTQEALDNIAREFVLSHLSEVDAELKTDDWVKKVIEQVKKGELLIEFSQVDESVTLKTPDELSFDED